jgi:hypothetical protein
VAEPAPGVFLSCFVPRGQALGMNLSLIVPDGPKRGVALHPDDWERIPGADRERFLDDVTRGDAARGLRAINRFVATSEGEPRG